MSRTVYQLFNEDEFSRNAEHISSFHAELKEYGYVYVDCSDELLQILQNLQSVAKDFFDLPKEEKAKFSMKNLNRHNMNSNKIKRGGILSQLMSCFNHSNDNSSRIQSNGNNKSIKSGDEKVYPIELRSFDSHSNNNINNKIFGRKNSNTNNSDKDHNNKSNPTNRHSGEPREFYDIVATSSRFQNEAFAHHTKLAFDRLWYLSVKALYQVLYPLECENVAYIKSLFQYNYLANQNNNEPIIPGFGSKTALRLLRYYYQPKEAMNNYDENLIQNDNNHNDYCNDNSNNYDNNNISSSNNNNNNMKYKKVTCHSHTDMGLLSVAFCLDDGLEMKEFNSKRWVDVERNAPKKPCLIIFCGEALAYLTGGYFKAILHQVKTYKHRYSFPFFFRVCNEAIIDINQLKSKKLDNLLYDNNDNNNNYDNKIERLCPIRSFDLDIITRTQYNTGSIPIELGHYKQESYWALHDEN
eukprot:gene16338-22259_t